jgi:hypothetical protein
MVHVQEVVIDCADPAGQATFWAQLLQSRWGLVNDDWAVVDAKPVLICFQRVPEPKSSPKNRLHLDIQVPDAAAAVGHAQRLRALLTGSSELDADGNGYTVLRDPEGNEFCFVVDAAGYWADTLRRALES